ncbi:hypothetical protein WA026_006590 [Henosepilachna vigintioctopunctata]|uniref:Uncharacterized protein n=1 Tax=Henosepilachna vigintioctopunctata TaxID=420089 RepID=A0AAW1U782_9CUCU
MEKIFEVSVRTECNYILLNPKRLLPIKWPITVKKNIPKKPKGFFPTMESWSKQFSSVGGRKEHDSYRCPYVDNSAI